jgi:hypothetical protein
MNHSNPTVEVSHQSRAKWGQGTPWLFHYSTIALQCYFVNSDSLMVSASRFTSFNAGQKAFQQEHPR